MDVCLVVMSTGDTERSIGVECSCKSISFLLSSIRLTSGICWRRIHHLWVTYYTNQTCYNREQGDEDQGREGHSAAYDGGCVRVRGVREAPDVKAIVLIDSNLNLQQYKETTLNDAHRSKC